MPVLYSKELKASPAESGQREKNKKSGGLNGVGFKRGGGMGS